MTSSFPINLNYNHENTVGVYFIILIPILRGNYPITCSGKPNGHTFLLYVTYLIVDKVGSGVIGSPNQPSRLARSAGAVETSDVISVGATSLSDGL